MTGRIQVGVSACLLGEEVRYDGGHKLDRSVRDALGAQVDFIPVCPEFELGLGVPREPIGLAGDPERPRLRGLESGEDLTSRMEAWCTTRAEQLGAIGLSGFVLKARSPSCGIGDARVQTSTGEVPGTGLFAQALARVLPPELPRIDEESLRSPKVMERFIESSLAYGRDHG